ncbi:MAG: acyl carrier protein [Desulfovibrio sp.]|nr:acyl carrier protein [Desulfovibrio sp.]
MNEIEFLAELQEILQRDDPLNMDMILKDLDEWDSLAIMGLAALLDRKFGKLVSFDTIKSLKTVRDIAKLAGIAE